MMESRRHRPLPPLPSVLLLAAGLLLPGCEAPRGDEEPCASTVTVCDGQQILDGCGAVVTRCNDDERCVLHPEDETLALCNGTCAQDADCDPGLVCRRYGDFADCVAPAGNGAPCAGDDGDEFLTHSCAEGLVCERAPNWPDGGFDLDLCVGAADRVDFALCDDATQCASNVCITNVDDDGVCVPDECDLDEDCVDGTVCYNFGGSKRCIEAGGVGAPCAGVTRDGYAVSRTCADTLTCTDERTGDDDLVRCE